MPEFVKSVVLADGVTSTGVGSAYWSQSPNVGGRSAGLHVEGSSFNLNLQATNFFSPSADVGSFWTNVGSQVTEAGVYNMDPGVSFQAFRVNVSSVASGDTLWAGFSF